MSTLSRNRLVDDLVDAYVVWREACVRVHDASRSCPSETGARARVALGLYQRRSTPKSGLPRSTPGL